MKIELKKFGEFLTSRPAGREAFLIVKAYLAPKNPKETIELDFSGVKVLGPSWVDELVTGLKSNFPNPVIFMPSANPSVKESLKIISE